MPLLTHSLETFFPPASASLFLLLSSFFWLFQFLNSFFPTNFKIILYIFILLFSLGHAPVPPKNV